LVRTFAEVEGQQILDVGNGVTEQPAFSSGYNHPFILPNIGEEREIRYRWHPYFGRKVIARHGHRNLNGLSKKMGNLSACVKAGAIIPH
jgi:hypothetical protein